MDTHVNTTRTYNTYAHVPTVTYTRMYVHAHTPKPTCVEYVKKIPINKKVNPLKKKESTAVQVVSSRNTLLFYWFRKGLAIVEVHIGRKEPN